jgi:hypothetical protein
MLGNLYLRLIENFLEVTDAKFPLSQKVQDAQACLIAEALIDLNKAHGI